MPAANTREVFMKWTSRVALAATALALSWPVPAAAQPPGHGGRPPGPPWVFLSGGPMGLFGEWELGHRVEGAPYQAQVSTEVVRTLADGNRVVRRGTATVVRDGAGRIRYEQATLDGRVDARRTTIDDPVAGVRYVLFADRKVAHEMPGRLPPGEGRYRPRLEQGAKAESLGTRNIAGVVAEGTREILTIPAGAQGNEKAVEIVSERWYAPELQILVEGLHRDPLHGDVTYTASGITRGEPGAALFEVPAGYSIEEGPIRRLERER